MCGLADSPQAHTANMEGQTNATRQQQQQQQQWGGVAPVYAQQPNYAQQPQQMYYPPAPVQRKPFPSSALSICLILTVIGCTVGCIVALTATDAMLYDGMPSSCCAKAGGSLNWQDVYCAQCDDTNGCNYQPLCDAHPEWTACCFGNSCLTPSYKDLFIVCNTGNSIQGFDWTASSIGTVNFAHWPMFGMFLGGAVSALVCWLVLLKSRSNPDFLMPRQTVIVQQPMYIGGNYHQMP